MRYDDFDYMDGIVYYDLKNEISYKANKDAFIESGLIDLEDYAYKSVYSFDGIEYKYQGKSYALRNFYENGKDEMIENAPELWEKFNHLIIKQ